jgi:uncharacterized protein
LLPEHSSDLTELRQRLKREGSLVIEVKVLPRAAKSEVTGLLADGTVKAKVAAIPEKGKANEELRVLLASYFGLPKSKVRILSGETSQHKRVSLSR